MGYKIPKNSEKFRGQYTSENSEILGTVYLTKRQNDPVRLSRLIPRELLISTGLKKNC